MYLVWKQVIAPLHHAAYDNDQEQVVCLLYAGCDPNYCPSGWHALEYARSPYIIYWMAKFGANVRHVRDGHSILDWCIYSYNSAALNAMVDVGMRCNKKFITGTRDVGNPALYGIMDRFAEMADVQRIVLSNIDWCENVGRLLAELMW